MEIKEALKQNKDLPKKLSFQELKNKGLLPTKISSSIKSPNENENASNKPSLPSNKQDEQKEGGLFDNNSLRDKSLEENLFDSSVSSNSEDDSDSSNESDEDEEDKPQGDVFSL